MRRTLFSWLSLLLLSAPVTGQVLRGTQEIDFERPEAWAMQYFASVAQFTGMGTPERRQPGDLQLGVELGWIPQLSDRERTVGFNGTKREDLNKSPVFGRIRAKVGLPHGFTAGFGVTPPVEVDGATPLIGSLSLGRPIWRRDEWRLGLTGQLTSGSIEGEITCPEQAVAAGLDPVLNPLGCVATSDDELTFLLGGVGLSLARRFGSRNGGEVYVTLSLQRLEAEFQVRARSRDLVDHTRLETSGSNFSAVLGLQWPLASRWHLTSELYYTPLEVRRPPRRESQIDGLLNIRTAISIRLR